MNHAFLVLVLLLLFPLPTIAAPGAHGPDGEHLDSHNSGSVVFDGRPRMEGFSELFELVANVEHDGITVMINAYETNEPVDGAKVDLESGGRTIRAGFDGATGVYSFADQALVEKFSEPGRHSLVFTIDTGEQFDIVAGAFDVAEHEHDHDSRLALWTATLFLLLAVGALLLYRHRNLAARLAGVR